MGGVKVMLPPEHLPCAIYHDIHHIIYSNSYDDHVALVADSVCKTTRDIYRSTNATIITTCTSILAADLCTGCT